MIVVFDASTIVGAALKHDSTPYRALRAARERHTIALSEAVFAEVSEVLARPKFVKALPPERQRDILELLGAAALWVEPMARISECPDPNDDKYLELAAAADAAVIASSDHDLLDMHPWRAVSILRPADFLNRL